MLKINRSYALNELGFQILKSSNRGENLSISPLAILLNLNYILKTTNSKEVTEKICHILRLPSFPNEQNIASLSELVNIVVDGDSKFANINLACGACQPENISCPQIENISICKGKESYKGANEIILKRSENRIKDLFFGGHISDCEITVFGTMDLKAPFLNLFNIHGTEIKDFHVSPSETLKVPMMHYGSMIMYNEDKEIGVRMMRHYFYGGVFYLVIMVPIEGFTLEQMEGNFTVDKYVHLLETMRPVLGSVTIPKLSLSKNSDLSNVMEALGLNDGNSQHPVTKFLHGVSINLNEFGSNVPMRELTDSEKHGHCIGGFTKPPEKQSMVGDHPFLIAINYSKNNSMVSISRILRPVTGA